MAHGSKPPKDIFAGALAKLNNRLGREPNFTTATDLFLGIGLLTSSELDGIKTQHNQNDNQRGSGVGHKLLDKIKDSSEPVKCLLKICDALDDDLIEDKQLKDISVSMRKDVYQYQATLGTIDTDSATLINATTTGGGHTVTTGMLPQSKPVGGLTTTDKSGTNVPAGAKTGASSVSQSAAHAQMKMETSNSEKKMDTDGPDVLKKYDINKISRRGIAVIINNIRFEKENSRPASKKDGEDLKKAFEKLRYEVISDDTTNDLKAHEIEVKLKQVAENEVSTNDDSFICCILSHGNADGILGTDYDKDDDEKKAVKFSVLAKIFDAKNCPKLLGKPKLFFLQACRGTGRSEPMKIDGASTTILPPLEPMEVDGLTIPPEADFLFSFSTSDGKVAARSEDNGTPYIEELCKAINTYSDKHGVNSLLLIVNYNITRRTFEDPDKVVFKQMPEFRSTMRMKFMFK